MNDAKRNHTAVTISTRIFCWNDKIHETDNGARIVTSDDESGDVMQGYHSMKEFERDSGNRSGRTPVSANTIPHIDRPRRSECHFAIQNGMLKL